MKTVGLRRMLVAAISMIAALGSASMNAAERFSFVAMGCMPYGPQDFAAYERMLVEINRHQPAFTVHCGDTNLTAGRLLEHAHKTMSG